MAPDIPVEPWLLWLISLSDADLRGLINRDKKLSIDECLERKLWNLRVRLHYFRVPADTGVLAQVHARLKGFSEEEWYWKRLLGTAWLPVTEEIANDLIDRGIAVSEITRCFEDGPVLKRLSNSDTSAAYRLAVAMYFNVQCSACEFEAFLTEISHHCLVFGTLATLDPNDQAKESVLQTALASQPEGHSLIQLRQAKFQEIEAGSAGLTDNDFRRLWETGSSRVLLALAQNPSTPIWILDLLTQQSQEKFARQIRVAAANNVARQRRRAE
jgi:hypothetical protein